MEEQIRLGKRPGNPLRKRVWRDVLRDWKRYLMIFAILVVTIAFVSGMYVANNSMLHSMTENITALKRESGHFELDTEADEALLAGIASGERADVVAVFKERAYSEAEPEVEEAVRDAVAEEVGKQVTEAIRAQVTQAVEAQFAQAAEMGMAVPAAEKQAALDDAIGQAMRETKRSMLPTIRTITRPPSPMRWTKRNRRSTRRSARSMTSWQSAMS